MNCNDRAWFILLGFSAGIRGFKPAEIQEGGGAGISYTLVSAPVTELFDKENTICAYLPAGL